MNKAVMLSIRPELCAKFAFGEKTVEVRKTRPMLDPPFKCYIYETKGRMKINRGGWHLWRIGFGAIVGEFICDRIEYLDIDSEGVGFWENNDFLYLVNLPGWKTAMTRQDIIRYCNAKRPYGWHISGLKIYDEPRPLSDFGLKRPPQSWCYVKEVNE